jgi:transposase
VEKRVYVDECGIKSDLKREYGWSVRGKRREDTKRGRSYHRTNVVAAQFHAKTGVKKIAPMCYTSTMTAALFESWVQRALLPAVEKGATIIMDNATFHRKKELKVICEGGGVNLLFLPPYSPDFNPIEKSWANMKRALRDSAPLCDLLETAVYQYWRTGYSYIE